MIALVLHMHNIYTWRIGSAANEVTERKKSALARYLAAAVEYFE